MSESTLRKINKNVSFLQSIRPVKTSPYRQTADAIIQQYQNREITNIKTVTNFVLKLGSKRPEISAKKFNDYIQSNEVKVSKRSALDAGIDDFEPVAITTKKTTLRSTPQQKATIKKLIPKKLSNFFIRANVRYTTTYERTNKNRKTKLIHTYHHPVIRSQNINETISARSQADAQRQFESNISTQVDNHDHENSSSKKSTSIDDITYDQILNESTLSNQSTNHMMMKRANVMNYNFLPETYHAINPDDGFCVPNTFIGIYGPLIKKLTLEYFTDLCFLVRGEKPNETKQISSLDKDINDDDEEKAIWTLADGVSPDMINKICQRLNISTYGHNISGKCFLKHIATSRNYPAFCYYAIDNHMYAINNKGAVKSLVESAKDVQTKMNSSAMLNNEVIENIFSNDLPIFDNIPVKDLKDLEACIVMYNKNDLTEELDDIMRIYKTIPDIRNKKSATIRITFEYDNKLIYLVADANAQELMEDQIDSKIITDYKRIQKLCETHDIEFKNQSFNQLITQIKNKHFDTSVKRHKFTKEERNDIYESSKECKMCKVKLTKSKMQLDHIVALANGGTNELTNIQVLCMACHGDKTKSEKDIGYVNMIATESSFNSIVKDIFSSKLCGSYAFVEPMIEQLPKKIKDNTVHHLDINKCRKNLLYYGQDDYPVFSVMDEPVIYKGQTGPGLYYIETDNYFPLRSNGC